MLSADLTDWGLLICGGAYAALAITLRPGAAAPGAPRTRLRFAALATVGWAIATAWAHHNGLLDTVLPVLLSLALCGVWIWQLQSLARWQGHPGWLQRTLSASGPLVVGGVLAWTAWTVRSHGVPPERARLAMIGVLYCTFGLFAIEQLYRNAAATAQPALRWIGLGVGGVLLTELAMFAQALLIGQTPQGSWLARGVLYALCAASIVRGARRVPDWSFGLSVSRQIVFYAGSSVMIGAYLIAMGLAGWVLLTYSSRWHASAQVGFILLAVAGLALSLFSATLLQRLKVFISAHFYPQRYDYRAEWLRFTRTLSDFDPDATLQQRAIRAVAQIVGSPYGSLWRRAEGERHFERIAQWPVERDGADSVPEDQPLPRFLARTSWLVDLSELRARPDVYGDLTVDPASLAAGEDSLVVPLCHGDQIYGFMALQRAAQLHELNFEDRDLLKTAGRHVAAHLSQFDGDAQLAQAHQFEAYNRMTAFIMHDLKNIAAQLRLVSQNAERHRQNPEFVDDALRTVTTAATRMTKLIAQLTSGAEGGTLQTVDLATCAERACLRCGGASPVPQVTVLARPPVFADIDRLTTVLEHAIRNAQDATSAQGEVSVEVTERDGQPMLSVIDTGSGMDAQFIRERLFRPFDTTKGARGMGIGAFQVREYLRSIGGDVEVESEPGRGTTVRLAFAKLPAAAMGRLAG